MKPAIEPLPSYGSETILVAEDDGVLRKLFSTVLQAYGYKVILAEDGEDPIRRFMDNNDKIQLVMLDMIMPKKSGKEVYDKNKANKTQYENTILQRLQCGQAATVRTG